MWPGRHAQERPDQPALIMGSTGDTVTYRDLNDRSNQVAQLFWDAGLRFGDHIALLMENRTEFFEVCWAAQRSGLYFTCINWHFNADEAGYIVNDCDAQALVISDTFAELAAPLVDLTPKLSVRLLVGDGQVDDYESYASARDRYPARPLDEELEGARMLYSSGTTGRPKGIKYPLARQPAGEGIHIMGVAGFGAASAAMIYLSPAPLYHSAPLFYCMTVMRLGGTAVVMEQFDAEDALRLIERYHVTHAQFVPTMFVRLLKLPAETRAAYDLSSLQVAVHAAAPCPVEIKRQMIDWLGPIVLEYYAATEGTGATFIDSQEWLAHPGSVGRSVLGPIHILDEDGNDLPAGEVGTVWFEPFAGREFEYYNDEAKTRDSHNAQGFSSVGDMGYLDEEGFLYLTDRRTFMIVSGGVNIYPQEAENVLVTHPKVYDAAVFGIPDDEMGEKVHAVVQPMEWSDAGAGLEQELLAFCRDKLAHYKCPGSVDFERELPREPTGKLYKRLLRDRYWGQRASRII